jgi:hypothetical protein
MIKQMGDGNYKVWLRHNELEGMGRLVPMREEVYCEHRPHLKKIIYRYNAILNLQNQVHNINELKGKNIKNFPRSPLVGHYAKARP